MRLSLPGKALNALLSVVLVVGMAPALAWAGEADGNDPLGGGSLADQGLQEAASAEAEYSLEGAVSYLYPVYNAAGDPTSGIEKWADGSVTNYTEITNSTTALSGSTTGGWYVVSGTVATGSLTVTGHVKLILMDGAQLTATAATAGQAGICVTNADPANPTNSLTVYAQSAGDGMGVLIATGSGTVDYPMASGAGIGGTSYNNSSGWAINIGSNITINGGAVTATGGAGSAGIGGSYGGSGSSIAINGGRVTSTGGKYGAGIGAGGYLGLDCSGSSIAINGGTVTARGGSGGGSGIGGGMAGSGSNISISGGTVEAIGDAGLTMNNDGLVGICGSGAGIGGGGGVVQTYKGNVESAWNSGSGTNIAITGGVMMAMGGIGKSESGIGAAPGIGGGGSIASYISAGTSSSITVKAKLSLKAGATASEAEAIAADRTDGTDLASKAEFKKPYVSASVIAAKIGDAGYTTLAAALDAAGTAAGFIVTLAEDVDVTGGVYGTEDAISMIGVKPGVTLDLNGHDLSANIVVVFGKLLATGGGTLIVPEASRLVYSQDKSNIAEGMNTGELSVPVFVAEKTDGGVTTPAHYEFYNVSSVYFDVTQSGSACKLRVGPKFAEVAGMAVKDVRAAVLADADVWVHFKYGAGAAENKVEYCFSQSIEDQFIAFDTPGKSPAMYVNVNGLDSAPSVAYGFMEFANGFTVSGAPVA